MVTFWGVLVVVGVLLVGRYGGDGRSSEDSADRDAIVPRGQAPTVRGVGTMTGALGRRVAVQRRAWEAYDRALRPWDASETDVRR